jgi:hypothetical protein
MSLNGFPGWRSVRLSAALVFMLLGCTVLSVAADQPTITQDQPSYLPGDTITFTGKGWGPGEAVNIFVSSDPTEGGTTVHATADDSGTFSATGAMPESAAADPDRPASQAITVTATATGLNSGASAATQFGVGHAATDAERIIDAETYWNHRVTYPTGKFNPAWLRSAAKQDKAVHRGLPKGKRRGQNKNNDSTVTSQALINSLTNLSSPSSFAALFQSSTDFIPLGPAPEKMTGCSGCFDYGITAGRVNTIAIAPSPNTAGNIVAYIGTVGGGVWKTTNCCSAATTWNITTDDPLISTTSIDSVTLDPNNSNTIWAGTGDLNYGSFSMGSQGVLKSTDGGATWTVKGADVFGAAYTEPAGKFPQYDAVGKVRVDPNNSNTILAGTKKGLFISRDAGDNWSGPCPIAVFVPAQRQDITGLELSNISGNTRIIAAVGVRGFASPVQYDLDQNGANGIYSATLPATGCPSFASIARNDNGFVFGTQVTGSPYLTGALMNAGTGIAYGGNTLTGNQLGRVDIAVAPSDPNYIYAQVQSIAPNANNGCGNTSGCQLGVWASTNGGTTWTFMTGSAGGSLRNCLGTNTSSNPGDYPQNWYDQGMAVDPNDPNRIFVDTYDTWLATRTGTSFTNLTCGYNGGSLANHVVHVDHHALAFLPGSSSTLLEGSDGGIFSTLNANAAAASPVTRPTWVNMDTGLNTIEFYSGDISGNFALGNAPIMAAGGAQDNGPSSVTFPNVPTAPAQWQMGTGGDGFSGKIDPMGTGTSLRVWLGNNSGGLSRCISNCSNPGASWTSRRGAWTGDLQSFILPIDLFHGGITGGDDCEPAGPTTGCGHLIAGTTRVWETIAGATATNTWYITNAGSSSGGPNLTKGTLGNRSFINQVKYSPKWQSVAIVGTNDGNVQIGFNLGTGTAGQANWVNVTGGNSVLPNRPVLGIALDPTTTKLAPIGYAAVGGFDENTPTTPGHIFRVVCDDNCAAPVWTNKSGNLPNIPVDSIIPNPNFPMQVFAGTDFGLYFTDDITAVSPVWQRFSNVPAVMIWDMAIDRGATTLSLWTRGRGAYAWPLPTGPETPLPTDLSVAPASGVNGGSTTLTATLFSGGNPVGGKTINFALNGNASGSAVTDSTGTASTTASLAGIAPGTYPDGVKATFAGDSVYAAAEATNTLTVLYSSGNCLGSPSHTLLSPVSADGTYTAKQGSTVPAKFRVCDASGHSIGTPGVVTSFRIVQIITGATTQNVDLPVTSTNGDTAFRFDPTDQQWIFNISTKPLAAGSTYVFRITLNDGSTIDFRITLK